MGMEYDFGEDIYNEYNGFVGINIICLVLLAFCFWEYLFYCVDIKYLGGIQCMEMFEDFNVVAEQLLCDCFGWELANVLICLVVKEVVEVGLCFIKIKKKDDEEDFDESDEEEKLKEEDKDDDEEYDEILGLILGMIMSIVNVVIEWADIWFW